MTRNTHSGKKVSTSENIQIVGRPDPSTVVVEDTESESDESHVVHTDESGEAVHCTCKGFKYNTTTKHVDAVSALPDARATSTSTSPVLADGGVATETESVEQNDPDTDLEELAETFARRFQVETSCYDEQIRVNTNHVVGNRLFSAIEENGLEVEGMYPNVGETDETRLVLEKKPRFGRKDPEFTGAVADGLDDL